MGSYPDGQAKGYDIGQPHTQTKTQAMRQQQEVVADLHCEGCQEHADTKTQC